LNNSDNQYIVVTIDQFSQLALLMISYLSKKLNFVALYTLLSVSCCLPQTSTAQTQPVVQAGELATLAGTWTGELQYKDYGSGKLVGIPAAIDIVSKSAKGDRWQLQYRYPAEPKADSKGKMALSADGRMLTGRRIITKNNLPDGTLEVVTEETGKDNRQKAMFRHTLRMSATTLLLQKEVRLEGNTDYFVRNVYTLTREQ